MKRRCGRGVHLERLIYAAAIYGVEATDGTSVVIDIGGGTTDAVGDATGMHAARSMKLGVIRLTRTGPDATTLRSDERRGLNARDADDMEVPSALVGAGADREPRARPAAMNRTAHVLYVTLPKEWREQANRRSAVSGGDILHVTNRPLEDQPRIPPARAAVNT